MEGILDKAVDFAVQKHAGQKRKGTEIPYIVHPMEVMNHLREMNADTNLLIAGLLHDVIEDAGVTADEIRQSFGEDVAVLVAGHSEDKSKTWEERKREDIRVATEGDLRLKMLILSDKLANLRSLYYDYRSVGDALWSRFRAPVDKQKWYYHGMLEALRVLEQEKKSAPLYWEFKRFYQELFDAGRAVERSDNW